MSFEINKSLHEIFTEVGKVTAVSKKVKLLQENESDGLKAILRGAYDKRVEWIVPDTPPPYKSSDAPDWDLAEIKLEREALSLGRFALFDGQPTSQGRGLTTLRREQLCIQLLEGLHPSEAEILLSIIKKRLEYKGLTSKLVNQAFPDLIPAEYMVVKK